ncbi:hypothetical protein Ade02nite_03970 [Paractinoplanes deccanensis]|uniref:Uncharacterized protein n=1 Tax=Paractinoplanes deccanensis TaxID=113561 RepID=A0ABQ3XVI8_9ACTN|nr:hypothetical protein [Actinoplanes deccanensis]GID71756.1 hypothetical protein Ade02nite_03970 [Actinoplanes deccanensis]
MLLHSDLMLTLAHDRHRELIAEADRGRLLTSARLARAARKASKKQAVRGQPAGTIASCEPSAVVPAR